MDRRKIILLWTIIGLTLTACGTPTPSMTATPDTNLMETIVAGTLTAAAPTRTPAFTATNTLAAPATFTPTSPPTSTNTPQPTPTLPIGNVSGNVCYRTSEIPPMNIFFEDTKTRQTEQVPISAGQSSYTAQLPPGSYRAYAWLTDFSMGGLYSQYVLCGMKVGCTDHSEVIFEVKAGEDTENIHLCDWYAFNVPLPASVTPSAVKGRIQGQILYPTSPIPMLHVVAFNQNTGYYYYWITNPGAATFTIAELPPGTYTVVAYEKNGNAGAHADAASHTLTLVNVKAGETAQANINDWSAPRGSFPADPSPWE